MFTDLKQSRVIPASVDALYDFWGKGVDALDTINTYALESGMSPENAHDVFFKTKPLLGLIVREARSSYKVNVIDRNDSKLGLQNKWRDSWYFLFEKADLEPYWYDQHAIAKFTLRPPPGVLLDGIVSASDIKHTEEIQMHNYLVGNKVFAKHDMYGPAKDIFGAIISVTSKYPDGYFTMWGGGKSLPNEIRLDVADKGKGFVDFFEGNGAEIQTIDSSLAKLGWSRSWRFNGRNDGIQTSFFSLVIKLNEGDLVPKTFKPSKDTFKGPLLAKADLLKGTEVYVRAVPYAGYMWAADGMLDVSGSPIFAAIEKARGLAVQMGVLPEAPSPVDVLTQTTAIIIDKSASTTGAVASAGGVAGKGGLPPEVAKTVKDAEENGKEIKAKGKKGEKP